MMCEEGVDSKRSKKKELCKLFGGRRIRGDMVSVQGQVSMMSADKTVVLTETR